MGIEVNVNAVPLDGAARVFGNVCMPVDHDLRAKRDNRGIDCNRSAGLDDRARRGNAITEVARVFPAALAASALRGQTELAKLFENGFDLFGLSLDNRLRHDLRCHIRRGLKL